MVHLGTYGKRLAKCLFCDLDVRQLQLPIKAVPQISLSRNRAGAFDARNRFVSRAAVPDALIVKAAQPTSQIRPFAAANSATAHHSSPA